MIGFKIFLESKFHSKTGESEILYHVSDKNFTEFKPLSHFGTANAARARAFELDVHEKRPVKNIYAVRIKLGNTIHLDHDSLNHEGLSLLHLLHSDGHIKIDDKEYMEHEDKMMNMTSPKQENEYTAKVLRQHGIHSLSYPNRYEDPGKRSFIITHPSQVRIIHKGEKVDLERGRQHHLYGSEFELKDSNYINKKKKNFLQKLIGFK